MKLPGVRRSFFGKRWTMCDFDPLSPTPAVEALEPHAALARPANVSVATAQSRNLFDEHSQWVPQARDQGKRSAQSDSRNLLNFRRFFSGSRRMGCL